MVYKRRQLHAVLRLCELIQLVPDAVMFAYRQETQCHTVRSCGVQSTASAAVAAKCSSVVQGLHASVTILDAEMVGLDRQERVSILSDGREVQYGLLLLTAGLQDPTVVRLAQLPETQGAPIMEVRDVQNLEHEVCALASDCEIIGFEVAHACHIAQERGQGSTSYSMACQLVDKRHSYALRAAPG